MDERNEQVFIDIGTSEIRTFVVDDLKYSEPRILGKGLSQKTGLSKGRLLKPEIFKQALNHSVTQARKTSGLNFSKAFISLSEPDYTSQKVQESLKTEGGFVQLSDLKSLKQSALDHHQKQTSCFFSHNHGYQLDYLNLVSQPVGCNAEILTGFFTNFSIDTEKLIYIAQVFRDFGIRSQSFFPSFLGSAFADTNSSENRIVIDLGAGTTKLSIWESKFKHFKVLPIGGNHFTYDLAVGMNLSKSQAEHFKINTASLFERDIQGDSEDKRRVSHILVSRLEEIFSILKQELRPFLENKPYSFIFTGGAAKLKGMKEFAEYYFEQEVQLLEETRFKTATLQGLMNYKKKYASKKNAHKKSTGLVERFRHSLQNVFNEIF